MLVSFSYIHILWYAKFIVSTVKFTFQNELYFIEIHHRSCDLGKTVGTRTGDIFSFLLILIGVLILRCTFCWKPRLGRSVMSNWRILRTIEICSFFWLYLRINAADFRLMPLGRNTYMYVPKLCWVRYSRFTTGKINPNYWCTFQCRNPTKLKKL